MSGWVGVENEINAISAFNLVGGEVEVEAELGNNICNIASLIDVKAIILIMGSHKIPA